MHIDNLKTPSDVFRWLDDNIQYGWLDVNGQKHNIKEMKGFRTLYRTMSISAILEYKLGTCIEQASLIHYLLNGIKIKNKMYCCRVYEPDDYGNLEEDEHMHCFVLFEDKGQVYQFEYANSEKKGIHKYDSEIEAINDIVKYYIELRGGKASPTTQFDKVPSGLTFKEFNIFINHQPLSGNVQIIR